MQGYVVDLLTRILLFRNREEYMKERVAVLGVAKRQITNARPCHPCLS